MIEKLKVVLKPEDWNLPVNELEMRCLKNLLLKIDELVDAVNELQAKYDNVCVWIGEQKLKEPADPYAEQRKWIGKLCKFRDKYYKDDQWDYGLLQAVAKVETTHIWKAGCFKHNLGRWYDCCEPIKPDDDIIYKGGDNE